MLYRADGRAVNAAGAANPEEEKPSRIVEVTRSFSYKLAMTGADGKKTYEMADFFCSSKAQCLLEDRDSVSADLDEFCLEEVLESIKAFKARRAAKIGKAAA